MSLPIARVGDSFEGLCERCEHFPLVTGTIISSPQSAISIDGALVATSGSVCTASCGHSGTLVGSSAIFSINGKEVGRLGDTIIGFSNSHVTTACEKFCTD